MEIITDAFVSTEAFSGHWLWIVPAALALITTLAIGIAVSRDAYNHTLDAIASFGISVVFIGFVVTLISYGLGYTSFHEDIARADLQEIGIENVKFEGVNQFTGSIDGKYVECALLDTDVEKKYKVLCDN